MNLTKNGLSLKVCLKALWIVYPVAMMYESSKSVYVYSTEYV